MERVEHYHVDVFDTASRPLWSSQALPKSAAKREFERLIDEYRPQVGKFTIRPATEKDRERGFVGAIKLAINHRLSHCADEVRLRLALVAGTARQGVEAKFLSAEEVHVL
jgi:hypothetical protein